MADKILKSGFAVYPSVKLKGYKVDPKTQEEKFGFVKELLFGDCIKPYLKTGKYETITEVERGNPVEYIRVRARGADGYIKQDEIQAQRILEVNFVDIGQGDGCHMVTPDDKHFIIDAGQSDNMYRFLKWRFNLKNADTAPPPFTAIISHSDADHYAGFGKIFSATKGTKQQFSIDKIYHNGMVEFSGADPGALGTLVTHEGINYITDLCDTQADYEKRAKKGTGIYIKTLNKSDAKKAALRYGFPDLYDEGNMKIEVLGPVATEIKGKDALPVFDSNKGKTKNGHSVILKVTIGKLKILLGGDLNTDSEYYLLEHFSEVDVKGIKKQLEKKTLGKVKRDELEEQLNSAIEKARETFQVDIAKSCHHGSADFTSEFLKTLNPIATVISSGDEEPHTHPRPDTLGTIGKHSRGDRSLIFSTELARSGKEFVEMVEDSTGKERAVTVYGMINLRTDGEKVVIAQKLERKASGRNWDIHVLEWNESLSEFEYVQYKKYEKKYR